MERQTNLAEIIDAAANRAQYDAGAKRILAFKAVDAWILKTCVKEFYPYSVEYISEHCLGDDLHISEHAVHPDQLDRKDRINGDNELTQLNSESNSISEGVVYYDLRFNAVVPGSGNPVTLIINIEVQVDDRPGYELVTRGMYYCSRIISEQHGTVFSGNHYEKIEKVYSIWICPSTSESRKNSMFRYHIVEEPVVGISYVKEKAYDLEEVIVLNLGEAEIDSECDILNLLNTLFSSTVCPEKKKRVLSEKYNITMTKEMDEEVQNMCNLGEAIERKGRAEGIAEGIAEGRAEGKIEGRFETTLLYYKKGRITAEEAAYDLGMPLSEFLEKAEKAEDMTTEEKR